MRVVVFAERLYIMDLEGRVWTNSSFDRIYYQRIYLGVFDEVLVVAKVKKTTLPPVDWKRVDGDGVSVYPLPNLGGVRGIVPIFLSELKAVFKGLIDCDAVILRGYGPMCAAIELFLRLTHHPYGVEVTGDPYDVFTSGAIDHPLRGLLRRWFTRELKRVTLSACAVAYVAKNTLQKRYPPNPNAFVTYYSRVNLPEDAFVHTPRLHTSARIKKYKLISVGSMAQRYKGFDILIQALHESIGNGLDLTLTLVGDGKYRAELESLSERLGLKSRVIFTGELPGPEAVRKVLFESDLFVHPSRAEGLPRALLEAMAQGLPCIGTNVGGIPELLPPEDMVEPGDVKGLADKIKEIITSPARMDEMSKRNIIRAMEFRFTILQQRRIEFYRYVRNCTEQFLCNKKSLKFQNRRRA